MKHEIKRWFDGRLLYECEAESLSQVVQKAVAEYADLSYANLRSADLSSANLSYANLSYANLRSADLSSANLSYANLSYSDLSSANLSYANLSYANLSYANLSYSDLSSAKYGDSPILDIVHLSGIGSARRMTSAIILPDSTIIQCGCFTGTLGEFRAKVEETHKDNPKFLTQYRAAVAFIEACEKEAREVKE